MEQRRHSFEPSLRHRAARAARSHLIGAAQKSSACILSVINRQNTTKRRVPVLAGLAVLLLAAALFAAPRARAEPTAEVLHWWTSGGEARALKVIADRCTA